MCREGKDVIRQGRRLIGATNPLEAQPGTIRGDYCISVGRNIIHGSDSFESGMCDLGVFLKLRAWVLIVECYVPQLRRRLDFGLARARSLTGNVSSFRNSRLHGHSAQ